MKFRPRIRILPDGEPAEMHYCGWWPEGWSSLGPVAGNTIQEAIQFYFLVLGYDGLTPSQFADLAAHIRHVEMQDYTGRAGV